MRIRNKIIIITIAFALFYWIIDVFIDSIFFVEVSQGRINLFNVSSHENYMRLFGLAMIIIFGTVIAKIFEEREFYHEELEIAKRDLERQNEELKELDTIKDSLIRDVSHELKTPVAKQKMQLELLKRFPDRHNLAREGRGMVGVLEASIERQEKVIHNILDLSRLRAGGRIYEFEPTRLDQVIDDVLEFYQFTLEKYGFVIEKEMPEAEILSDREMLFHVFSNLINNSIKYRSKKNAPKLKIVLLNTDKSVIVKIIDNGVGLSVEDKVRAFSAFYRGSDTSEGSGVGLTICQKIINDLGGKISLSSDGPEKGVTVVVEIPL